MPTLRNAPQMVLPYKHPFKALGIGILLGLLVLCVSQIAGGENPLQNATQYTGRVSALLFLPVFIGRPLVDLFGPNRTGFLLRHRSGVGVAMAGNHHVHMLLLTVLLIGEGASASDFLGNPALYIYGLLILMNATSFPNVARAVPRAFVRWLHLIGFYALAIAFFETLVLSVAVGEEAGVFRIVYSILFGLACLVRILAGVRQN